jgi:hypothetical protein
MVIPQSKLTDAGVDYARDIDQLTASTATTYPPRKRNAVRDDLATEAIYFQNLKWWHFGLKKSSIREMKRLVLELEDAV